MNKIPAEYVAKWINYTINIEAAFQAVKDLRPCVPYEIWQQVRTAEARSMALRDQLMIFAVQDVAVEPIEPPVRVVDVAPQFVMAAE